MSLEIERKWLVSEVRWPNYFDRKRDKIEQTYLVNKNDKITERVRILNEDSDNPKYFHTVKTFISPGVNEEVEREVSFKKALKLLGREDNRFYTLRKSRITFYYDDKKLELDIFEGKHCLMILEVELSSLEEEVKIPDFIKVVKEVTGDHNYSNVSLAKR